MARMIAALLSLWLWAPPLLAAPAETDQQLQAVKQEVAELERGLKALEEQATALRGEMTARLGPYEGLQTLARAKGSEMEKSLQESLITAQYPNRVQPLQRLALAEGPDLALLQQLGSVMLQELRAQGEVSTFQAPVVNHDGHRSWAS